MVSPWWRRWLKGISAGPWRRTRPPWSRLSLEIMEDRVTPNTVNWIGGSGDWSTASNWRDATSLTNHVPGATDDAIINVPGISVTYSGGTDTIKTVTAADPISLSGGTLNVAGNFSDGSTVTLSGGTLANATVAAGTTLTAT